MSEIVWVSFRVLETLIARTLKLVTSKFLFLRNDIFDFKVNWVWRIEKFDFLKLWISHFEEMSLSDLRTQNLSSFTLASLLKRRSESQHFEQVNFDFWELHFLTLRLEDLQKVESEKWRIGKISLSSCIYTSSVNRLADLALLILGFRDCKLIRSASWPFTLCTFAFLHFEPH